MNIFNRKSKGFTLIELVLVVAIIGLISAIALPKFGNMVIKAKEASIRGKLGGLRSALSIYYADNDGLHFLPHMGSTFGTSHPYPLNLLVPKYLSEIPKITLPYRAFGAGSAGNTVESDGCQDQFEEGNWYAGSSYSFGIPAYSWSGGFRYFFVPGTFEVHVNNSWPDSLGVPWSKY